MHPTPCHRAWEVATASPRRMARLASQDLGSVASEREACPGGHQCLCDYASGRGYPQPGPAGASTANQIAEHGEEPGQQRGTGDVTNDNAQPRALARPPCPLRVQATPDSTAHTSIGAMPARLARVMLVIQN